MKLKKSLRSDAPKAGVRPGKGRNRTVVSVPSRIPPGSRPANDRKTSVRSQAPADSVPQSRHSPAEKWGRRSPKVLENFRIKPTDAGTGKFSDQLQRTRPQPVTIDEPPARQPYDAETAFNLYLREIGEVKLLTLAEENELARRIRKGDAKAREHMIKANLRFVVKIARDYEGYGLPLLDLINEGNIGLMKGVERFDPRKGAKLSTYAAWWIKQAIKRALANQSKTIRLPVHVVDKLFHLRRAAAKMEEALGREPTDEELAEELDYAVERVRQWRKAAVRPVSLEAPLGDDRDGSVAEVVKDERANSPFEQLQEKTTNSMIHEMVGTLDQREQTILRLRFGLDGDDKQTLETVGEQFGVTRERIRQIEEQALKKLRRKIEKLESVKLAA